MTAVNSHAVVDLSGLKAVHGLHQFVGKSALLWEHLAKLPKVARGSSTVLILGETGTGKELTARAIHYLSSRSDRAFVPVNCGALPAELVENELFGHVAGAYTGAGASTEGLVSEADGGTLFLDEVDSLPAAAQAKLLRFLQDREVRPVGGRVARKVNARVIAASNADLRDRLREGRFRIDLFYRLNVVSLRVPPLRERREDIPELAAHFARKFANELGVRSMGISAAAQQRLLAHGWAGNVRELENVIERAVLLAEGDCLEVDDVVLEGEEAPATGDFKTLKARAVASFERSYITDLLQAHQGNITHAARAAGKNRRAFWELLRKHGMTVRDANSSPPPCLSR